MDQTPEEKEVARLMLLLLSRGAKPNPRVHFDGVFWSVWVDIGGDVKTDAARTMSGALARIEEQTRPAA